MAVSQAPASAARMARMDVLNEATPASMKSSSSLVVPARSQVLSRSSTRTALQSLFRPLWRLTCPPTVSAARSAMFAQVDAAEAARLAAWSWEEMTVVTVVTVVLQMAQPSELAAETTFIFAFLQRQLASRPC